MSSRDETALVRDARAGSTAAAEELVRLHWADAYRAAYLVIGDGAEAEDVTQEAMILALRSLNRFRDGRPFRPWLHKIAVNRAIDAVRARDRRAEPTAAAGEVKATHSPDDSDDELRAAVRSLSPDQRAAVVMRFVLGYGPGEIASMLGVPRGTIGSRLRRGLDALRRQLEAGR